MKYGLLNWATGYVRRGGVNTRNSVVWLVIERGGAVFNHGGDGRWF